MVIFRIYQVLITAVRTIGGLAYLERIEELDEELTKVTEDFDRAVNVEALRRAKETGKWLLSRYLMLSALVQNKSFCLSGLHISTPAITKNSAVWKAPANIS